jgi:hypothetical protein
METMSIIIRRTTMSYVLILLMYFGGYEGHHHSVVTTRFNSHEACIRAAESIIKELRLDKDFPVIKYTCVGDGK